MIWDIVNNVTHEYELYKPMCDWLESLLRDRYRKQKCNVIVRDTSSYTLDKVLQEEGLISEYPHIVGLDIQIDVLGIVRWDSKSELIFVEAKKTQLNLHNLGQLWAYCKLCDPAEAYLLSSVGLGSLDKVLKNMNRTDLLDFGDGRFVKKMIVGRWDVLRKTIDSSSVVPKI